MALLNDNNPITADGAYDVSVVRGSLYIITLTGNVGSAHVNIHTVENDQLTSQIASDADGELYLVIQCPESKIRIIVTGSNGSTSFSVTVSPARLPAMSRVVSSFADGGFPVSIAGGAVSASIPSAVTTRSDVASASFNTTRPSDTNAYASGDLIANSTTAGSVIIPNASGFSPIFRSLVLRKSGTSITNASFRVHLFSSQPTTSGGDNAPLALSQTSGYLGAFDVTVDRAFSDASYGIGLPIVGSEIINPNVGGFWCVIEARAAYTPISAEVFSVSFSVFVGS